MIDSLYWIVTTSYAFALLVLLQHDVKFNISNKRMDKAYRFLVLWVVFFCLQDSVWGIAARLRTSKDALFVLSMMFHVFTAMTAWVWLNFILSYLGKSVKHRRLFLSLESICVFGQITLVIINIFKPVVYSISENCEYVTEPYRPLAFGFQYIGYVITAIVAVICLGRRKSDARRYQAVLLFIGAPLLFGLLLLYHPELPLNSMGYFFGCVIIHSLIVSSDREELHEMQYQKEIDRQIQISHTDEMTGLLNRRAYEDELRILEEQPLDKDLVYVALDINGLKVVNDTKGHLAGDELIQSAANIIQKSFGEYGKVYRIGGDEFAAIIHLDRSKTKVAIANLRALQSLWRGKYVKELSISMGCVSAVEYPEKGILEVAILADKRMYKDKREYYSNKGIDRRGSAR